MASPLRVNVEIVSVRQPTRKAKLAHVLVHPGFSLTWLPEPVLRKAGIRKWKEVRIELEDKTIKRWSGYAIVRAAGFETVDEVLFGTDGDPSILGSRTLHGFRAIWDVNKRRLVNAGPSPAFGLFSADQRAFEENAVRLGLGRT
jgi:hypothetical protein